MNLVIMKVNFIKNIFLIKLMFQYAIFSKVNLVSDIILNNHMIGRRINDR